MKNFIGNRKIMNYNPLIHHRRSTRLKNYDYGEQGLFFITICCQDKAQIFGNIENGIKGSIAPSIEDSLDSSIASKKIIALNFKIWQRNYHNRIIRDENAYHNVANYILNNPKKREEKKNKKYDPKK